MRAPYRGLSTKLAAIILIVVIIAGAGAYMLLGKGGPLGRGETAGIIKVGVSVPLTGPYADIGKEFLDGLLLWAKKANEQGIRVGDRVYTVKIVYYDDGSKPENVPGIYYKLLDQDYVDFLITPPIDDLAAQAVQVAEERGKVIIVTSPGQELFLSGQRLEYSYQIASPSDKYMIPVLQLLETLDPNSTKTVALVFIDSPFARQVASGVKVWIGAHEKYQLVFEYYYTPGTTNFESIVRTLKQIGPTVILGGGGVKETEELVVELYRSGLKPKLLALLDAPLLQGFAELGDPALGVMAPSEWEATASYSPIVAQELGLEWYGIYLSDFVIAFNEEYGRAPTPEAAKGFAAGMILQYAIEKAASTDTRDVMRALDEAMLLTFYGPIQFDSNPDTHGRQILHTPLVIQWIERQGSLQKVVVAPKAFALESPVYPLPWS